MLRLLRQASDSTTNKMPQINTDLVFAPPEPSESRAPLVNKVSQVKHRFNFFAIRANGEFHPPGFVLRPGRILTPDEFLQRGSEPSVARASGRGLRGRHPRAVVVDLSGNFSHHGARNSRARVATAHRNIRALHNAS
jgi:hypothetical protein